MQKLIEDPEAEIGVELSSAKIRFTIGSVVLTTKLIDGSFPDYARVIPSQNDKFLTVERKDFRTPWIASPPFPPNAAGRSTHRIRGQTGSVGHQSQFRLGGRGAGGGL